MHQRSFGDWSVDLEAKNAQDTHKAGKKQPVMAAGLLAWFTVIALGILNFGIGI